MADVSTPPAADGAAAAHPAPTLAPGDETTPLLQSGISSFPEPASDQIGHGPHSAITELAPGAPSPPAPLKLMVVLTRASLLLCIVDLAFLIATYTLMEHRPHMIYLGYLFREAVNSVTFWTSLALVVSTFNVIRWRIRSRPLPLALNLLLDLVFTTNLIGSVFAATGDLVYPSACSDDNRYYRKSDCDRYILHLRILAGIAVGVALVIACIHLILFLIRCVLAYRSRFWERSWHVPTGQLTVEFTIKFLRQEREQNQIGEAVSGP